MLEGKSLKVPDGEEKPSIISLGNWWYNMTRNTLFEKYIEFPWKNFKTGIRNIFKWLPIVWKDRDWDDYYIFVVLKFKIDNTRNYILKKDRIADFHQERINRYASICLKLIDAVTEEKYGSEYLDYFESEYNWIPTGEKIDNEETYQLEIKEISNRAEDYFKKYPRVYKRIVKRFTMEDKELITKNIALSMSHENQERAKHLLFKVLANEIESFWD